MRSYPLWRMIPEKGIEWISISDSCDRHIRIYFENVMKCTRDKSIILFENICNQFSPIVSHDIFYFQNEKWRRMHSWMMGEEKQYISCISYFLIILIHSFHEWNLIFWEWHFLVTPIVGKFYIRPWGIFYEWKGDSPSLSSTIYFFDKFLNRFIVLRQDLFHIFSYDLTYLLQMLRRNMRISGNIFSYRMILFLIHATIVSQTVMQYKYFRVLSQKGEREMNFFICRERLSLYTHVYEISSYYTSVSWYFPHAWLSWAYESSYCGYSRCGYRDCICEWDMIRSTRSMTKSMDHGSRFSEGMIRLSPYEMEFFSEWIRERIWSYSLLEWGNHRNQKCETVNQDFLLCSLHFSSSLWSEVTVLS